MENVEQNVPAPSPPDIEWQVTLCVVALGVTCLITQVVVIRELLSIFYGNELVIGVLLANWMLLTGLGALLGRFASRISERRGFLIALLILLATVPFFTVCLLRLLRNVIFPVGTMVGVVPIIWSSLVLLIPYCILSGGGFTLLSGLASRAQRTGVIGAVYAREAIGSLIGGIVFSLVLIYVLNTFQSLAALMAFDLAVALAVARGWRTARAVVWILSFAFLVPAILINVDAITKRFLFPNQEFVYSKETPYGSLTVTAQAEQKNFYENNVLLSSTNDVTTSEETVHYAMIQHPAPRTVLMISGAISGAPQEVLKYNVERIDYVEVNPYLIDLAKRYTAVLSDRRISIINEDARLFVRETQTLYDVVLLNTPQPATVQVNRYYTVEFFERLKHTMNPDGILSLGLLSSTDYQSDEARRINSTIMNTLRSIFKEVLIVPGLKTYFLASDARLDINIGRMVERSGISNTYVNQYYLDDETLARRSDLIQSSLFVDAPVNRDFAPVSYYRHVIYWLNYFRTNLWVVGILVALVLVIGATQLNAISAGVFTGGFAASSIEVLLLIAFQIIYGYVYQVLGVIVTIFMAGLAVGSLYRLKILPRTSMRSYAWIQFGIAIYCFLLPVFLLVLRSVQGLPFIVHAGFFLLTFVIAALIGLEFSMAATLRRGHLQRVASELYGIDLIGSSLGALLVAAWLVPTLGIFAVSLVAGSLSLLTAFIAIIRHKAYAGSIS